MANSVFLPTVCYTAIPKDSIYHQKKQHITRILSSES